MNSEQFDLVVIGAGSAARSAAGKASEEYGARVAMIERTRWGGSCPNVACRPTKAYLVAAELAHDIDTLANRIGVQVGPARPNLATIKSWKDSIRSTQEQWRERLTKAGYELVDGAASFEDGHNVRVGDRVFTGEHILVATGSRTAVPPVDGIEAIDWLDHVSALELTELPESLLVVGGGAVGLEFAQAFARFGSTVTIVDALDRIAFRDDRDAAAEVAIALEDEGVEIILNTFVKSVRPDGDEIVAALEPREGSDARELRASRVLIAAGRLPNVEELELEKAGIERTKAGIAVDSHLRTAADGVWAAGDVTGLAQFTPIAQYQGRLAVDDMFTDSAPEADYSALPTAIFTDPELGGVGLTEDEARDEGLEFDVATHPLTAVTRAQYTDSKHGLYKVVFDTASRRVLGVHVVNRAASEIVQGLAVPLKMGVTVDDLAQVHHTYPSLGEGVKAAAEKAVKKLSLAEKPAGARG
jgi:pyruvate/2-oxoglutarate dehydrogenase complex dihydrolipoamide dehydrogenase (E3) component